jgi:hypothetical protein
MQTTARKKVLVTTLWFCFAVLVGVNVLAGHFAVALGFAGLGIFGLGLHGVPATSKARLPIFGLSMACSLTAIGLLITTGVV